MSDTAEITTIRGATWAGMTVTFSISSTTSDTTPVDLTDASILMQCKKDSCDEAAVIEFTTGGNNNITLTTPVSGIFTVDSTIIDVEPRSYYYDVMITTNAGIVYYPLKGRFVVTKNTSRD